MTKYELRCRFKFMGAKKWGTNYTNLKKVVPKPYQGWYKNRRFQGLVWGGVRFETKIGPILGQDRCYLGQGSTHFQYLVYKQKIFFAFGE